MGLGRWSAPPTSPRAPPRRPSGRRRRWRSGSARRRSSSTTSTARCCSHARAWRSTTSLQTRSNLLAALMRSPAAIGVMRESRTSAAASSPCARTAARWSPATTAATPQLPRSWVRTAYCGHRTGHAASPILSARLQPRRPRLAVGGQGSIDLLDGHTFRRLADAAGARRRVRHARLLAGRARAGRDRTTSPSTAPIRPVTSVLLRFDGHTGRPPRPVTQDRRARRARRRRSRSAPTGGG